MGYLHVQKKARFVTFQCANRYLFHCQRLVFPVEKVTFRTVERRF